MIKIIYKGLDENILKSKVLKALNDTSKVFKDELGDVTIYIFSARKEFNRYIGEETARWHVATASFKNKIAILSPSAMEKESSHDKGEFLQILKHELTHLFVDGLARGKTVPKWLNEGLAAYVAKQHKDDKSSIYFEENFCKKLATRSGWNKRVDRQAYRVAALFVLFLIKKYSFDKIKELLLSLDKNYCYPNFKKTFFAIYHKELVDLERLFIATINSK